MTTPIAIVTDAAGTPILGPDGHPQERRLAVDSTGAMRTSGGGGGGGGGAAGTEYIEDTILPANPSGGILIARRKDVLTAAEVSADGEAIALNATAKGELTSRDGDAIALLNSLDQKIGTTTVNGVPRLNVTLAAGAAPGAAVPAFADLMAGSDGTFLRALLTDAVGRLFVNQGPDTTVTGPAAQSALNTDLLTGNVNGWYDAASFQSGSIQIIASAGISAGAIIFEQTNDTTSAPAGVPLRAYEASLVNANPNVAAFNIAASTARIFSVPVNSRFIRVRISTAFVGGTVQAVATLSQRAASFPVVNVQQATAANLNATVSGTVTATVLAGTVQGTVAEDAATTGNPIIIGGVVRTAVAPTTLIAGDAARASMTSGGALVVKDYAPAQTEFAANLALSTTTAVAIANAAAAGIRNHITSFWAINTGAAAVDLIILDGATERARYTLPINVPVPVTFPTGLLTTAATALNANLSAVGTVRLVATGYTSA